MKVNLIYPGDPAICKDDWILKVIGDELSSRIDFARAWRAPGIFRHKFQNGDIKIGSNEINYFIDYVVFTKTPAVGGAYFSHPEDDGIFMKMSKKTDFAVVVNEQYRSLIKSDCFLIYPGIDLMYQPKLVLGFVGRVYEGGRKGEDLLDLVSALDFVELKRTDGKYKKEELPDFYQSLDYVLVTSSLEGGPMCLVEGAVMGKRTICPLDVGHARDFSDVVVPYKNSDWPSLLHVLQKLYDEKKKIAEVVSRCTWDRFAEDHLKAFRQIHDKLCRQSSLMQL